MSSIDESITNRLDALLVSINTWEQLYQQTTSIDLKARIEKSRHYAYNELDEFLSGIL